MLATKIQTIFSRLSLALFGLLLAVSLVAPRVSAVPLGTGDGGGKTDTTSKTDAKDKKKAAKDDTPSGLTADCGQDGKGEDCPKATTDSAVNCGQDSCNLVTKYLNPLITFMSGIIGIVVVISIILGGIQYATSTGDPQKTNAAKSRITKSIVALVAFGLLYTFLQFLIPGGVLQR